MTDTISLKQIAEVSSGQSAPQGNKYFGEKGYPFVRAGSLESLLADGNEDCLEKINEEVAKEFNLQLYPKGTILFAKSGMSATKDRVYVLKSPCYVVSHLAAIIPKRNIDSTFLKFWFRKFRPSRLIRDRAYPSIRLSDIEEIKIPDLKDIDKKKIAAILDISESARARREEANRLTDEFFKSIFFDIFGDPVRNPKGWDREKLKNVIRINYGKALHARERDDSYAYAVYGSNGLVGRYKDFFIDEQTIIIGRKGSCGEVVLTEPKCWAIDTTFYVEIIDTKRLNLVFLYFYLKHTNLKQLTISTAVPGINRDSLYNVNIFLPPLERQRKFTDIVQKVEKLKEKQRKSGEELNDLFNSLMQKAFRGGRK